MSSPVTFSNGLRPSNVWIGAVAGWIGNWNTNVQADVNTATTTITSAGKLPVFVAYNIPQRDCGGYSGSNSTSAQAYRDWITAFANGFGARKAVVILEPDALAAMDCLSATDQQRRLDLLSYAVQAFAAKGSIAVYLDAGHSHWKSAATIAQRLLSAGIAKAQGFSLNVANFYLTSDITSYGTQVSARVGGKHFIIDTGRNGLGPAADGQWCNPRRARHRTATHLVHRQCIDRRLPLDQDAGRVRRVVQWCAECGHVDAGVRAGPGAARLSSGARAPTGARASPPSCPSAQCRCSACPPARTTSPRTPPRPPGGAPRHAER